MESKTRDWLYNNCLGSACPESCCAVKTAHVYSPNSWIKIDKSQWSNFHWVDLPFTIITPEHEYNTTLTNEEAREIAGIFWYVTLDYDVWFITWVSDSGLNITGGLVTMKNCLWDDWCSIGEHKPHVCKLFPFSDNINWDIAEDHCPAWLDIASDLENIQNMLKLRKDLWLKDNNQYLKSIHTKLVNAWKNPDREVDVVGNLE